VTLVVDTSKLRTEAVRKYATVSCNDPRQPQIRLTVGGKLRHVVKVEPASLILRGATGADLVGKLTFSKGTDLDITVTGGTAAKNLIYVGDIVEISAGEKYEIQVEAPKALVPGMLRDILNVEIVCSDGVIRTTSIPVTVDHQAPISVIPRGNIVFQRKDTDRLKVAGSAPVKRDLQIYSTAPGTRFNITSMTMEGTPENLFRLSQREIRSGERYLVTVEVTEPRPERSIRGTLRILTDHPDMPEVTARVYAQFGVPTPIRRPVTVPGKKPVPSLKVPGKKATAIPGVPGIRLSPTVDIPFKPTPKPKPKPKPVIPDKLNSGQKPG
jgi:hypothetical protein